MPKIYFYMAKNCWGKISHVNFQNIKHCVQSLSRSSEQDSQNNVGFGIVISSGKVLQKALWGKIKLEFVFGLE